jgi:hypothetical protein
MYSFQALPGVGERFTGWTATRGILVFTPGSNTTWSNVSLPGTVTAHYATTVASVNLRIGTVPSQGGTVSIGGKSYSNGALVRLTSGAYPITAHANSNFGFDTWTTSWSATLTNFSATSTVDLQNGSASLEALFSSSPAVTVLAIGGGAILLNGVNVSGQKVVLSQVENETYTLVAAPYPGHFFVYWNVSPIANLTPIGALNPYGKVFVPNANLTVNASGQLIGFFGPYPTKVAYQPYHVYFFPGSGTIVFNGIDRYTTNSTAVNLFASTYALSEISPTGDTFEGWTVSGGGVITIDGEQNALGEWQTLDKLDLTGNATVTARFAPTAYPVTFVDVPSSSGGIVTWHGPSGTVTVPSGATANLLAGSYSASLSGGTFSGANWTASSNLTLTGTPTGTSATISVDGSGTLYALAVSQPVVGAVANPATTGSNLTTWIDVTVFGGTEQFTFVVGPASSVPVGTITCTPSTTSTRSNTSIAQCVSTGLGTFTIDVRVTDALGLVSRTTVSVTFA